MEFRVLAPENQQPLVRTTALAPSSDGLYHFSWCGTGDLLVLVGTEEGLVTTRSEVPDFGESWIRLPKEPDVADTGTVSVRITAPSLITGCRMTLRSLADRQPVHRSRTALPVESHVIEGLAAGRYRLELRPDPGSPALPLDLDVEVEVGRDTAVAASLPCGGWIDLELSADNGCRASARLSSASGELWTLLASREDPSGIRLAREIDSGASRLLLSDSGIPPGEYVLSLACNESEQALFEQPVRVHAGQGTPVRR